MNRRWRICERMVVIPLLLGALTVLATGCHHRVNLFTLQFGLDSSGRKAIDTTKAFAMDSIGVQRPGACAAHALTAADSIHQFSDSIRDVLPRNGYCTYLILGYHDVQPLRVNDNVDYGPTVWSFASPWVANYTRDKDFEALWLNVAIVKVDATSSAALPAEYQRLHLRGGFNCLFLYHDRSGRPPRWRAAMVRSNAKNDCGNVTITADDTLSVQDEHPFPHAADYPPVTRFIESADTRTFIGVRCGNRWCDVGAKWPELPNTVLDGIAQAGKSARWRVKGWFDEQHLAIADANQHLRPRQLAALIPSDSLSLFDSTAYDHAWKLVATVYFPDPPTGKYGDTGKGGYGWTQGFNKVWLHSMVVPLREGVDTVKWMSAFGDDPGGAAHFNDVVRTDHRNLGLPVPWTARWRWVDNDEQMWVACLMGCCMVKPITD